MLSSNEPARTQELRPKGRAAARPAARQRRRSAGSRRLSPDLLFDGGWHDRRPVGAQLSRGSDSRVYRCVRNVTADKISKQLGEAAGREFVARRLEFNCRPPPVLAHEAALEIVPAADIDSVPFDADEVEALTLSKGWPEPGKANTCSRIQMRGPISQPKSPHSSASSRFRASGADSPAATPPPGVIQK